MRLIFTFTVTLIENYLKKKVIIRLTRDKGKLVMTTVEETTPVETPDVENTSVTETNYKTSDDIDNILKELDATVKQFKMQITRVRALKKDVQYIEKSLKKLQSKKTKKKKPATDENGVVKKNGFARPTDISNQLADFLGIEHGVQVARTEVTKKINSYVKENNLQDPEKRRCIRLDSEAGEKLKSLLTDVVDNEGNPCDLNFINIQKYIKHHFPKKESKPTVTMENTVKVDSVKKKTIKRPIKKKPNAVEAS